MPPHDATRDNLLDTATRPARASTGDTAPLRVPILTVLCHPDPSRVGERAILTDLVGAKTAALSRLEPRFAPAQSGDSRPLEDPHLSRRPFMLKPAPNGHLELDASKTSTLATVDGEPLKTHRTLGPAELARGLILVLARRIALVLRASPLEPPASCSPEILGESVAIQRVRRQILRVADLDMPVLLRGETGTGKELVARAVHDAGPRHQEPYLAVNMGALPRELAAVELFGANRGAYTGAHLKRRGFFARASGGTLFLDEIGATPTDIQVLLLRILETRQIQPVGAEELENVDTRIVSATDADLDAAIAAGEFRSPLLHRLAGYEIVLPPLRERREDLGILWFRFLQSELAKTGESERLQPTREGDPWMPAELVARLALYSWPGNVRQLGNVARQLAVASRGASRLEVPHGVRRLLESAAETSAAMPSHSGYRPPEEASDDEIKEALKAERFIIARAAARLGMSETAFKKRMQQCPETRNAKDLESEEIERALRRFQGDVDAAAEDLEVSPHGLRIRIRDLDV